MLYLLSVIFPALMIAVAISDLATFTIPNRLALITGLVFVGVALVAGMPVDAIALHLAVGLAILVVTFGFFALGWVGGGDAKIVSAIAVWVGLSDLLSFLLVASIAGGLLTLTLIAFRRVGLHPRLAGVGWIGTLHGRAGIPYGVALAIGAMIVYPSTSIFALLVS